MVHRGGREATAPNIFIFAACPPIRTTTYGMQPPVERDVAHVLPLLWARHGLHCTTLQQARLSGKLCRIWKPDVVQRQTRRTHPLLRWALSVAPTGLAFFDWMSICCCLAKKRYIGLVPAPGPMFLFFSCGWPSHSTGDCPARGSPFLCLANGKFHDPFFSFHVPSRFLSPRLGSSSPQPPHNPTQDSAAAGHLAFLLTSEVPAHVPTYLQLLLIESCTLLALYPNLLHTTLPYLPHAPPSLACTCTCSCVAPPFSSHCQARPGSLSLSLRPVPIDIAASIRHNDRTCCSTRARAQYTPRLPSSHSVVDCWVLPACRGKLIVGRSVGSSQPALHDWSTRRRPSSVVHLDT